MNNIDNWGAWGRYDTSPTYSPRAQIAALAAPITDGSDPSVLTPSYLMTKDQIENTRLDAIVGGYYKQPVASMDASQRARVGDYWRRAEIVRTMRPAQIRSMIVGAAQLPTITTGDDGSITFQLPRGNTRRATPPPGASVGPKGPARTLTLAAPKRATRLTPAAIRAARTLPYRPNPKVVKALLSAPLLVPPSPSPTPEEEAEIFFLGFEEAIQAAATVEEVLGVLVTLDENQLAAVLTAYPEILELLQSMGYFSADEIAADEPVEIGSACCSACARDDAMRAAGHVRVGDVWGDIARAVATVDQQVLGPVWEGVKEFVPYGQVFDQLHQGRMGLLREHASEYYAAPANPRPTPAPVSAVDAMILDLQTLTRAARKGDEAAHQRMATLKQQAEAGNADARRRWNSLAVIAQDDERRLNEGRA